GGQAARASPDPDPTNDHREARPRPLARESPRPRLYRRRAEPRVHIGHKKPRPDGFAQRRLSQRLPEVLKAEVSVVPPFLVPINAWRRSLERHTVACNMNET